MHKTFAERLENLIDKYFEDASTPLKKLHDEVISALELKLMALKEEEIEEDA